MGKWEGNGRGWGGGKAIRLLNADASYLPISFSANNQNEYTVYNTRIFATTS